MNNMIICDEHFEMGDIVFCIYTNTWRTEKYFGMVVGKREEHYLVNYFSSNTIQQKLWHKKHLHRIPFYQEGYITMTDPIQHTKLREWFKEVLSLKKNFSRRKFYNLRKKMYMQIWPSQRTLLFAISLVYFTIKYDIDEYPFEVIVSWNNKLSACEQYHWIYIVTGETKGNDPYRVEDSDNMDQLYWQCHRPMYPIIQGDVFDEEFLDTIHCWLNEEWDESIHLHDDGSLRLEFSEMIVQEMKRMEKWRKTQ